MKSSLPLVGLAVLLSLATGNSLLAHSATEPAPRPDQWWKDRHESFNQRVAEVGDQAQVVFIGDSITQGWEGEGKEVWAKYYASRRAVNLGTGGDRTQHVLWRLAHGNLAGLKPKAAVVMIGTNNSSGEENTPGQIVDGVTAIVNQLRAQLPGTKVLLLAIFPRSENYSATRGKLAMINQVLRKLADDRTVFWVDFSHQFLNPDGTIPPALMPDYLHLSPAGYAIWAEAIEDRLATILGDTRVPGEVTAPPAASLTGEWTWTITGPEGKPVSAALVLKQDGEKVTGKFARDETRWLEIEHGQAAGGAFTWTVKRDRPNGASLIYQMSGKLDGDQINGKVKVDLDGNEVTSDWSAKRK